MRNHLRLITLSVAVLGATASAQLDFSGVINVTDDNVFFSALAKTMHHAGGSLGQTEVPPEFSLYSDFVLEYNVYFLGLPDTNTGTITTHSSVGTGGFDASLHFQHVPNFHPWFRTHKIPAGEDRIVEVAFIHANTNADVTFGVTRDATLADHVELFHFGPNNPDTPPLTYNIPVGQDVDEVSFYGIVDADPGARLQADANFWRIFRLMEPEFDGITSPAMYILALEDGTSTSGGVDFADGFFLIGGYMTPVPEPKWIGMGAGLALLLFAARRRRRPR